MGWEVWPDGLYDLLLRLQQQYKPKAIYITENGAAYDDAPDSEGRVRDVRRQRYLHGHLQALQRALATGVAVRGYFVWSLLDNFEWSHGYSKRFGLTWVDYDTGERCLKDSARWYQRLIQTGSIHVVPAITE